ncbi:hypothetical protein CROQUDRAFT_147546 [Cronartium quercuum f. sp. fusiforme G11]|uniref:Uncharacterized protein n=1 Tax=Cronartium quercuum f. sp. fusiforme G11 TaxID=708437 RepID=A0A9P6NY66_9BASI|nr:hypothetical protein CROQUDRAFT_147546 [Cronartium quercuum f. sp. fusiforme G11]
MNPSAWQFRAQEALLQASLDHHSGQKQLKARRTRPKSRPEVSAETRERLEPALQTDPVEPAPQKAPLASPQKNYILPSDRRIQPKLQPKADPKLTSFDEPDYTDSKARVQPGSQNQARRPPELQLYTEYQTHQPPNPTPPVNVPPSQEKGSHNPSAAKDGSDNDPMAESFVDPHLMTDTIQANYGNPSHHPPPNIHHLNNYGGGHLHPYNQEPPEPSTSYAFKPLVYDPEKNPYPPPGAQVDQTNRVQEDEFRSRAENFPVSVPPAAGRSLEWVQAQNAERARGDWPMYPHKISFQNTHPIYPTQSATIPFPVPTIPSTNQAGQTTNSNPPAMPQAQVERQTYGDTPNPNVTVDSHAQYGSQDDPVQLKKRPSKLSKLRRKPSESSQASSTAKRSVSSIDRVKSLLSALQSRRASRDSARSGSVSTQDQGPNTPSSADLEGGGSGRPHTSRLRPMQAQFNRLFRKHNHPDALRRQQRSMLINRDLPKSEQPIKGKGRSLDFSRAAHASQPIIGMHNDETIMNEINVHRATQDGTYGLKPSPSWVFRPQGSDLNQAKPMKGGW